MTNEEYVRLLYRRFLGREADPEGLKTWTALAEKEGSINQVLEGLIQSPEYAGKAITGPLELSPASIESNLSRQLSAAGIYPISDTLPTDVFVTGYPKSGNTWMQYLLAALICGVDPSLAPDAVVQAVIPDVGYKKFYTRFVTPTFFKTHCLPTASYRKVIYLVRDGRDVMVSYFHFLAALGHAPDFLELVTTGEGLFPCRWHEHVEAWLANPNDAEMIVVRYEALKEDTVNQLRRICDFAGIQRDAILLEKVAQNSTFSAMRERERKFGWENSVWPRDKSFMRRGIAGSYKDEMPEAVLKVFVESSLPTLKRLGYL